MSGRIIMTLKTKHRTNIDAEIHKHFDVYCMFIYIDLHGF